MAVNTADVRPNWEDPTVVKLFGAKLKQASTRQQLQSSHNKQVMKYSDVALPLEDFMPVLKATFKVGQGA